jgi:uncharacterized protein (DUF1501 family)
MNTRRSFLKSALTAAAVERFSRMQALAAGDEYRALVCVFLFGGNDCHNTVVPLAAGAFRDYQASRGALALAQGTLLPVTAGGASYGLHPRLGPLQQLFNQQRAAIVANVGMLVQPTTLAQYRQRSVPLPHNLFSHSDQQTQWQAAVADGSARYGWAGLAADRLLALNTDKAMSTVSLSGNAIFLAGRDARPSLVTPGAPTGLTSFNTSAEQVARLNAFSDLLASDEGYLLVQSASQITSEGMRVSSLLSSVISNTPPLATAFPATTLGRQLEQIARLIRARNQLGVTRQIYFASLGGWDMHLNLIANQDTFMNQLGPELAAFYKATDELGVANQVTTFTESEFGRTLNQNSTAGSDHGWGSHHFVIGGAVKGGQMYGTFPTVALNSPDDASGRGVWIPTTSLDQYGATLASWFGVPDAALYEIFPNLAQFSPARLGFL